MTELSSQFRLDVALEDAFWACKEAAASVDWYLESIEPSRLVLKKGVRFGTGSLSRIELVLSEDGAAATAVTLNGKYPGGLAAWAGVP